MPRFTSQLERVRVAAPCRADWDSMVGDERVRFCHQCERNVYNLSGMSRREAEAVVVGAEGRLCVRFYRRADGSILTENCPVGLRALKRRVSRVANAVASAALGFFTGLGLTPSPRYEMMGGMTFYPRPSPAAEAAEPSAEPSVEPPAEPAVAEELGVVAVAGPLEEGWVRGKMAFTRADEATELNRARVVRARREK